jgi:predicted transglutaminase-like cysteine proteinase
MMRGHAKKCDCLDCFSFRLATRIFLIGLALLAVVAALFRDDSPQPVLINATKAMPAPSSPAKVTRVEILADPVARLKFPTADPRAVDLLAAVNNTVNQLISPEDDQSHYGMEERIVAWPPDFKGDCEDVALSKMELLGNMGLPLAGNAILLTVLIPSEDGKLDGHAILQLRLADGQFMYLDSNFDEPMTKRELVGAGYHFFDWTDR